MKFLSTLPLVLILLTGCGSPEQEHAVTGSPIPKGIFSTHLSPDTTYVEGSVFVFLLPDRARANELASKAESDDSFLHGVSNTLDSLKTNPEYRSIKGDISTSRYISIKDCLGGPIVIDRDTVNYGFIMSAKGKGYERLYNNARHGNDYSEEIDGYFLGKSI